MDNTKIIDGVRNISGPDWRTVRDRRFNHGTLEVQELIIQTGEPPYTGGLKPFKLLWVRNHFSTLKVDDRDNCVAHSDLVMYSVDQADQTLLEAVRRRVREAFEKYWGLTVAFMKHEEVDETEKEDKPTFTIRAVTAPQIFRNLANALDDPNSLTGLVTSVMDDTPAMTVLADLMKKARSLTILARYDRFTGQPEGSEVV